MRVRGYLGRLEHCAAASGAARWSCRSTGRGAEQTFAGASHHFRVDRAVLDGFGGGRPGRRDLYMALLAADRCCCAEPVGPNSRSAHRSPRAAELERLGRHFVDMLPIRAAPRRRPTFIEAVARVRETVLDAWSHQELPFEQVVEELETVRDRVGRRCSRPFSCCERDPARAPDGGPLTVSRFPFDLQATRYDLELYAFRSDGLECMFVYNSALFTPERIGWLAGHLTTLLASAWRPDRTPRCPGGDMLTERGAGGGPRATTPRRTWARPPACTGWSPRKAARSPDAVAVRGRAWPAQLRRARPAGPPARRHAVGRRRPDRELVAVVMERGAEQVVATLAIELAGAACCRWIRTCRMPGGGTCWPGAAAGSARPSRGLVAALEWPEDVRPLVVDAREPEPVGLDGETGPAGRSSGGPGRAGRPRLRHLHLGLDR